MNNEIMTVKELAEYLKLAEKTVCKLAAEGKIPAFKVGKFWRFRKSDVDNWTEENQGK